MSNMNQLLDVIIIGGGPAGLNAGSSTWQGPQERCGH